MIDSRLLLVHDNAWSLNCAQTCLDFGHVLNWLGVNILWSYKDLVIIQEFEINHSKFWASSDSLLFFFPFSHYKKLYWQKTYIVWVLNTANVTTITDLRTVVTIYTKYLVWTEEYYRKSIWHFKTSLIHEKCSIQSRRCAKVSKQWTTLVLRLHFNNFMQLLMTILYSQLFP